MSAAAFQVASLVNPPSFPNSVVWSEDNLIAVATGDIVTILNPEKPHAPRGVITVTVGKPFPVGVIDRADLLSGCLLPTCLSRDRQPCVRALSWSPAGFSLNSGEDIDMRESVADKLDAMDADSLSNNNAAHAVTEIVVFPSSSMQKGSLVEVFQVDGGQHMWLPGKLQCLEGSRALVQFSQTDANKQISSAKHNEISEILKAGRQVEAWTADRWIGGVFMGFSDDNLLVKFSGDAAAVTLKPSDVRLAPLWVAEEKSWRVTLVKVVVDKHGMEKENNSPQMDSAAKARTNRSKRMPINRSQGLITAHQYASRYSMLSSVVVAWSPVLKLSATGANNSNDFYALLAVGAKSGDIAIWRIRRPLYYSIEHHDDPTTMILVGVLKAHNAWVTALSWGLLASDPCPRVLLASGSSDGSVKIWIADGHDLEQSSEANQIPFSLFNEVAAGGNVLVSAFSLLVPVQSPHKILLAVGKGSGSLDVWTCNARTKSSKKVGSYEAHVQVVTGLAWAFDGRCLYSCSLDNSMHGWIHHKGSLSEVSIPPNNLGKSSSDLPSVSDSCYGLAISPGNLALAVFFGFDGFVTDIGLSSGPFTFGRLFLACTMPQSLVRRFDAVLLDEMYQKRTKRAAVEFFWIGGQQTDISSIINSDFDVEACPGFSKDELKCWGSKLLWSLSQFECHDKHIVIWDIITASLAFEKCAPKFIEHIFLRWRVMLSSGLKESKASGKAANPGESSCTDEERPWMDLMLNSEKQLRERLVGICLSAASSRMCHPAPTEELGLWNPAGIAQMLKWVTQNRACVHCQLHIADEYKEEEECSFCSAAVPFESPETAVCQGVKHSDREPPQKHKLARCSVSMQVCPLTPLWFCICCQRWASRLPPHQLFTMPDYPPDLMSFIKHVVNALLPKPLCPFCGISLQKLQPDFLLSISPV
ncbi:hypothetical protein Cgig2_019314 [Carnegiea gigantea]|uniref:Transcription factor IIIC 90kDa subunit N-terminal domain-containing protein n=1 Tax=Carnegiea gigantea TaxID=171969 RepID=A0A9Q1KPE0_9CARY|nr:hypothetical protein Cgig2_019314 [Carnegiea gigantea]